MVIVPAGLLAELSKLSEALRAQATAVQTPDSGAAESTASEDA